jgi:hypothetical protein
MDISDVATGWDASGFGTDTSFIYPDEKDTSLIHVNEEDTSPIRSFEELGGIDSTDSTEHSPGHSVEHGRYSTNSQLLLEHVPSNSFPGMYAASDMEQGTFQDVILIQRPPIPPYDISFRGSGSRYPRQVEVKVPKNFRFDTVIFVPSFCQLVVDVADKEFKFLTMKLTKAQITYSLSGTPVAFTLPRLAREADTELFYKLINAHFATAISSCLTTKCFFRAGCAHAGAFEIEDNGLPSQRAISDVDSVSVQKDGGLRKTGSIEVKTGATMRDTIIADIMRIRPLTKDKMWKGILGSGRVYQFPLHWPTPTTQLKPYDQPLIQVLTQLSTSGSFMGQATCVQREFLLLRDDIHPNIVYMSPLYHWRYRAQVKPEHDMLAINVAWWLIANQDSESLNLRKMLTEKIRNACGAVKDNKPVLTKVPEWRPSEKIETRSKTKKKEAAERQDAGGEPELEAQPTAIITVKDGFWKEEWEDIKKSQGGNREPVPEPELD